MPLAALARKCAQLPQSAPIGAKSAYQPGWMSSPGDTEDVPPRRLTVIGGSGGAARRERATPVQGAGEPVVRARLAALTDRCWQCRTKVRGVVGVLIDPARTPDGSGFLAFDEVAEMLAERVDSRALARRGIGALRHRDSPGVAGGYLANGCIECDALIGRFQLEDLLTEHLKTGGTYAQLDIGIPVELPAVALARRLAAHG
jgi:hypothetical protein